MMRPENAAAEKQEKHFVAPDSGEWMQVTNAPWENDGFISKVDRGDVGDIGTYNVNNNRLAFVDSNQEVFIGYPTEANIAALEKAGYTKGSMGVPFSNGENPTHEGVASRMREFAQSGEQQMRNEAETAENERIAAETVKAENRQAAEAGRLEDGAKADALLAKIREGGSL